MIIKNKKQFAIGMGMTAVFFAVLGTMFLPIIKGQNAFEASDGLFNSISKASTNHFATVSASVLTLSNNDAGQTLALPEAVGKNLAHMLTNVGATASYEAEHLTVSGNLTDILQRIVSDSKAMFDNTGDILESAYGLPPEVATHAWWVYTKAASKAFKLEKRFPSAKILDEVNTRAVEVGYNYFGVEPTPVSERMGIMTFALVFYVFYTLWWGFSIFYLFEGLGLMMTKSASKQA